MPSRLNEIIGQDIFLKAEDVTGKALVRVVLRGVETGGVWIEYQPFTNTVLQAVNLQITSNTPIFFVPYAQINFIVSVAGYPALSEGGLGLSE